MEAAGDFAHYTEFNARQPLAGRVFAKDELYISHYSRVLTEAGVPNVLWAECLMMCYTIPTGRFGIDFIVPDDLLHKAKQALLQQGFTICNRGEKCHLNREDVSSIIPAEHVHCPLDAIREITGTGDPDCEAVVKLQKKSHYLWTFPDIPLGSAPAGDPYYMAADDATLPQDTIKGIGRFQEGLYPVKILRPTKFYEVIILLHARDELDDPFEDTRWASIWDHWKCYMGIYVLEQGLLHDEEVSEALLPVFRCRNNMQVEGIRNVRRIEKELQERLIQEGVLPPPPRPKDGPNLRHLKWR